MTRRARAMCSAHGAVFAWLGYCAVQSARNGALWAAVLFTAASAVSVVAAAREDGGAGEQRAAATQAEHLARPPLPDAIEQQPGGAVDLVAAALTEECERWWTSTGNEHDDTCPNNDHRSAA
ncbi:MULTISPECIES: hypothetical protein [Streptomyces]